MRCSVCGVDHPIEEIEPAFARPDAYVTLSSEHREANAKANEDLCRIDDPAGGVPRQFVRAVLPVNVEDRNVPIRWGLWVEVSEDAFRRILELWSVAEQASEPPIAATLANHIPSYPETVGLACWLHLTGPTTRPSIALPEHIDHPLASEYRSGVSAHRAIEWAHLFA